MNQAVKRMRPGANWLSAALITLFVISFGIFAEFHLRPDVSAMADACTGTTDRLFIRYY